MIQFAIIALCAAACRVPEPPPIDGTWEDNFEREEIGANYFQTGPGYRIVEGALQAMGAHNHPLWLRKKLPEECVLSFDAWSTTADIKVEVFGDGVSYDRDGGRYLATSYVIGFGGWGNTQSFIARKDEHGDEMVRTKARKVEPNRRYRFRIERKASKISWYLDADAAPFLQYDDVRPLRGATHAYFAFNNWESETWFDKLKVEALP